MPGFLKQSSPSPCPISINFLFLCLICLISAWIPWRYIVIDDIGIAVHWSFLLRFFPTVAILFVTFIWFLQEGAAQAGRKLLTTPHIVLICSFSGVGLLGAMNVSNSFAVFLRIVYYFLSGALVYCLSFHVVNDKKKALLLCYIILVAAVGVGLYGIMEFALKRNLLFDKSFSSNNPLYYQLALSGYSNRIMATIGHPVYAGTFLMMCLPLGLFIFVHAANWKKKALALTVLMAILTGLFLTFTRGAWIGAFIGSFFYLRKHPEIFKALVVLGILFLFLGIGIGGNRLIDLLKSRNPLEEIGGEESLGFRFIAYKHVAGVLAEEPLFGIGTGNYRYLAQSQADSDDTPDNMYLRILAENGILGFIIFIGIFHLILRNILRASRQIGRARDLLRAFAASLIAFSIDILTCDALYFPLARLIFWSFAGVGMAQSRLNGVDFERRNGLLEIQERK